MPGVAVNVAVLQDNKILLTQREDFETWILPGGGVEDGETVAQAALRETKEETGLDIELTRLVGIYFRKSKIFNDHIVLFAAIPIGGKIQCQPGETIAVKWFPFDRIPVPLSIGHKKRIEDVLNRASGICVTQKIDIPNFPLISRKELYEMRDRSGLSRQEFYLQLLEGSTVREYTELGDF